MRYYHRKVRTPKCERRSADSGVWRSAYGVRRCLRDDRGVAMLEGILFFLLLAGVLLACIILGQWGTHLQNAQLGARLLAFNAGNDSVAKFGRAGDQATQTFTTGSWDTLAGILPANWLNMMFVLPNERFCGRVSGTQRGRLPGQTPSIFDFSSASMGYFSNSCAASNPWGDSEPVVQSEFLNIAYYVGRYRVDPKNLDSIPGIPPAIPLLETIYGRVPGLR
jgi:hypothetical protein